MIVSPEDVMQFYYPGAEPNYITSNQAVGEVCVLEEGRHMGGAMNYSGSECRSGI